MECCRVALSSIIGDGVSGMVVQSSLRTCRHLGGPIVGRSECFVSVFPSELGPWRPGALAGMYGLCGGMAGGGP